ncbi:MAG TPA: hypothetical protein VI636_05455 [Candidatus Angelobacter sp.]
MSLVLGAAVINDVNPSSNMAGNLKQMAQKQKPMKPVGTTGVITVSRRPSGPEATFKKLEFPRTKEEIEQFIVNGFLRAARDAKLLTASVSALQNEQNSFDFQLQLKWQCQEIYGVDGDCTTRTSQRKL